MAAEKKGSKGNFLYLFDWHAKSRQKLFSTKSEPLGGSNQVKRSHNSTTYPFRLREAKFGEEEYFTREAGNYNSESAINKDNSYGTKAPSVVARLMGLESLPATTVGETSSVSSRDYESQAVGKSFYPRIPSGYQHDRQDLEFSYTGSKCGEYHWSSMDYRSCAGPGRPIERFQNEVLPPKSAKPISITHHKLLSPIKSPGFIPTNNAAYIMEAAARFIDPSVQEASLLRTPSFGSSSTPIKIRDLKDKMEAAHRLAILPESSKKTKRSFSANNLSGYFHDRLVDKPSPITFGLDVTGACSSTRKGKSVPSAINGKDSMHRKDMSSSNNNRKRVSREHNQVNLKQPSISQSSTKKSEHTSRNSTNRRSSLLRLNEKQNRKSYTDNGTSKSSITNKQPSRSVAIDDFGGSSKRFNKTSANAEIVSKRVASVAISTEIRPSLNRMKNISRSKELPIKDRQVEKSVADDLRAQKNEQEIKHDIALQNATDTKMGMDVISFTFNSPIKKSASVPRSNEMTGNSSLLDFESRATNGDFDSRSSSSPLLRLNLIGCDDLSLLLEQKLKELTNKVELSESPSDLGNQDCDNLVPSCSELVPSRIAEHANSIGQVESLYQHDPYSAHIETNRIEEIEGEASSTSSNPNKFYMEGDHMRHFNCSVPCCYFPAKSCVSPNRSGCSSGNAQAFSHPFEEETSCTSMEPPPIEDERDISDTTSSSYYDEWDGKRCSTSQSVSDSYVNDWELQYLRQIVHFAGLKDIVLDSDRGIIDPTVFDQAENLINISATNTGECTKLGRILLFDCLNDCLSLKFEEISFGSYRAWFKWRVLLQKDDWLVEELYKEVLGLLDMENLIVDELVEKDMGTTFSGWLAFEIEALEEGMDMEKGIVDSLIDEIVAEWSLNL